MLKCNRLETFFVEAPRESAGRAEPRGLGAASPRRGNQDVPTRQDPVSILSRAEPRGLGAASRVGLPFYTGTLEGGSETRGTTLLAVLL